MIQGVNERQSRCTIERTTVIEGGCDVHGGFVHVRNAEVDFSHDGQSNLSDGDGADSRMNEGRDRQVDNGNRF